MGDRSERDEWVGPVDFVLVPGAGGQAWYWHRVVAELERRGHRAIAVDLPAADDDAGLEAYTEVVVAAADDLDRVVLVGQSMGALSATMAAARLPSTELLVLVNAMVPLAGETGAQWWEMTGQPAARAALADEQGRAVGTDVDPVEDFFHDVPDDVTAEAMATDEVRQSERPFTDAFPLRHWPDVATRVVAGRDDRFFPLDFQRRVTRERLGITPDVVPGGHLVALARPVELVDQFEAHLVDLPVAPPATDDPDAPTGVDVGLVRDLEEGLWRDETRFDRHWMDRVLHADFVEFGQSGRTWDRDSTLAVEPAPIGVALPLADLQVVPLGADVVLVTYRVVDTFGEDGTTRDARRCSVWVRTDGGWRLRFHQGTPVPADPP